MHLFNEGASFFLPLTVCLCGAGGGEQDGVVSAEEPDGNGKQAEVSQEQEQVPQLLPEQQRQEPLSQQQEPVFPDEGHSPQG